MNELRRIRNWSFAGGAAAGITAGFLEGVATMPPSGVPFHLFQGLVLIGMAGFFGGFSGVFMRGAYMAARGTHEKTGDESITGISLGMFIGGTAGLLTALLVGGPEHAVKGAAGGAFVVALLCCLPGTLIHAPFTRPRREPS